MDSAEREKRTTEHPVAYTVKKEKPYISGADIGFRMGLIAAVSAGIAMLVRRTVSPETLKLKPDNLSDMIPTAVGFSAAVATAALALREKEQISRRHFLYYFTATGLGAGIGVKLGATSLNLTADKRYEPAPEAADNQDLGENFPFEDPVPEQTCDPENDPETDQATPGAAPGGLSVGPLGLTRVDLPGQPAIPPALDQKAR